MKIKFKKLSETAKAPKKQHKSDAAYDIYADDNVVISDNFNAHIIPTGIAVDIPEGYYGRLVGRSGLQSKTPMRVVEGTIDSGYRGEIGVNVYYQGDITVDKVYEYGEEQYVAYPTNHFKVQKGERIAQLIIQPKLDVEFIEVDTLDDSDRGDKGFGSTGV